MFHISQSIFSYFVNEAFNEEKSTYKMYVTSQIVCLLSYPPLYPPDISAAVGGAARPVPGPPGCHEVDSLDCGATAAIHPEQSGSLHFTSLNA